MNRAFRAIRRSDVVALVIEAMACITEQVLQRISACRDQKYGILHMIVWTQSSYQKYAILYMIAMRAPLFM